MIDLTPTSIKGGVVRVIDSATGDIARTTSGWIEDEKYGWYGNRSATAFSAEFDSAVTRTGRLTLKLSATDTTGTPFAATTAGGGTTYAGTPDDSKYLIHVKPSTVYRLNCYVKTNNIPSNGIHFTIQYWDSNKANRVTADSNKLTGTNDWTLLTKDFTTNATGTFLRIVLNNAVAGNISDAWFDVNSMTLEEVSTITNSGSSPALFYPKVTAVSSTDNIDQSLDTGGAYANTYAIPTAIDENATHRQTFTPTKKKNTGVRIWPIQNGTGDWTVTIHNAANTEVASATIANASVVEGALLSFLDNWEWTSGAHHFHVTSTVNDGTLKANTSNDLETASFTTLYSKNTTNFTVSTATETVSVTAPTVDGWANGTVIDTSDGTYGVTPLTLAPGANNVYYSSNGPATADGEVDPSLQATIDGTADEVRLDATIRPLNKDTDNEPIQDAPAPYQSARRTIIENQPVSSCISLNVSTTTLEVGAFGGQGALIRWIPKTETAAVSPFASVIASGADVNYDHYIPPSEFRRFAIPRESSAPSVSPTGVAYVKYKRVAIINAGIVASSILVAEY